MRTPVPADVALSRLDDLDPVGLEELNATAALLTRVDRKYLLGPDALERLLAGLPRGTRALEVAGERMPAYGSTYLDTPALDSFLAAAHGRARRWKVRTRTYVASGTTFLEVKTRRRSATVKERVPWREGAALGIRGGDFVAAALAGGGVDHDPAALGPVLRTRYRRATLLLPGVASRATIDLGLAWSDAAGAAFGCWDERLVLETKSGSTPGELDRLLWRLGHRPRPLSKYAVGMALLDPSLPRNRWHRLLAA